MKFKRFFASPITVLAGANIVMLLLVEGVLWGLAYKGILHVKHYPTTTPSEYFLQDMDPAFGVWRPPNRSVEHSTPCFNVEYKSNSHGARDRERLYQSEKKNRVVVLGDSFVMGYGATQADRMTDLAEAKTGIEFLNFGISGNFGSIQQWLLYKTLASKFDHSAVAIFHLPANDFTDNDPRFHSSKRYRPYLKESGTKEFEVVYPVAFEAREVPESISKGRYYRRLLYNHVHLFNLIRQFGDSIDQSDLKEEFKDIVSRAEEAPYNTFSELDLRRLLYSYQKIIELAGPRKVAIFVIPTLEDVLAYEDGGYNFEIITALREFAKKYPKVEVIDLLPTFVKHAQANKLEYEDYLHSCDDHWAKLGNRVAGDVLASTYAGTSLAR